MPILALLPIVRNTVVVISEYLLAALAVITVPSIYMGQLVWGLAASLLYAHVQASGHSSGIAVSVPCNVAVSH